MYERDPCLLMHYYIRKVLVNAFGKNSKGINVPLEKVWLYEDTVHPHVDKSPRPIEWQDKNRKAVRYMPQHDMPAWKINEFTQ